MMKKKTKTKTEASQFKWVNWRNALCAVYKWRLLPKCLIDGFYLDWWGLPPVVWLNGDFYLCFDRLRLLPKCLIDGFYPDWWRLLPVVWLNGDFCQWFDWWMGFIPKNGDFCLCFDWWRLLPNGWLISFIPRNDDLCRWLDWWWLLPKYGLLPLQWLN